MTHGIASYRYLLTLKADLEPTNESPAGLVESSGHQSRIHGQSTNVQSSHTRHHTVARLSSASKKWESESISSLPDPADRAPGFGYRQCLRIRSILTGPGSDLYKKMDPDHRSELSYKIPLTLAIPVS
jgi:hypothetical protein